MTAQRYRQNKLPSPAALALEFSRVLTEWLGEAKIAQIVLANQTPEYRGCCASHDFCDSNQAMIDAWTNLSIVVIRANSSEHAEVINRAWDIAKRHRFDPESIKEAK